MTPCWPFIRDFMTSKGNAVFKPALASSETCSDILLSSRGVMSASSCCPTTNKCIPMSRRERAHGWHCPICTEKTAASEVISSPWTSSESWGAEMHFTTMFVSIGREAEESHACFSPHWGQEIIYLKKTDWEFSEVLVVISFFLSCCCLCSHSLLSSHGRRAGARQTFWQIMMF